MRRLIFIIVFLCLGLVSQAQVFYSNDLTNQANTKIISGYIKITVDTDKEMVYVDRPNMKVCFKLIDAQIKQENCFTTITYVIEGVRNLRYIFYIVGNRVDKAIVFPEFDIIGQHAKAEKL